MATQGLSTIGIQVKVNEVAMNYVTEIGDIGGTPATLDATCMQDSMKKSVPGVQDVKAFEVTYLYDNTDDDSDYRVLKTLQTAGKVVPIGVVFPDGTTFTSSGYVSTYVVGAKVDELISAKLSMTLQSDWTVTDPSAA